MTRFTLILSVYLHNFALEAEIFFTIHTLFIAKFLFLATIAFFYLLFTENGKLMVV